MREIEIIYVDSEILVVNKPSGQSVHNDSSSLVELLPQMISKKLGLQIAKVYPVHRLDRETSGVQIFALDSLSATKYSELLRDTALSYPGHADRPDRRHSDQGESSTTRLSARRPATKKYIGVLCGHLKQDQGVWDHPISDRAEGRESPAGPIELRKESKTCYRVLSRPPYFSVVEFQIFTGRQHQIRKHAALAGHVLAGDRRYGKLAYCDRLQKEYGIDRTLLHCLEIEIEGRLFKASTPELIAVLRIY